jgi:glycosyltransferase involved in cell wall biosynthesis
MAPKVSVVVDNHNYGRFLPDALDSVLAQGLGDGELEVLVADDGSTDESREVLASYAPRVKALLLPKRGQWAAFNEGLRAARGEVVCLLDSDDRFLPGKLAAVLKAFEDPAVGCVQHLLHDTDASFNPLPRRFPAWPASYSLDDLVAGRLVLTATSGLSFRRSVLERCLPIPEGLFYYLDDYLSTRSLFFARMANIPRALGHHRVHGANWCAGGYENPAKLERDFVDRATFGASRDRWLAEAGLVRSPEALAVERLELWRRRVLLESLRARPAAAWAEWTAGLAESLRLPRGAFKAATVGLAALSPALYLALYRAYSEP